MTKTIFFGASAYSNIILKKLITLKNFPLLAVVTKIDKPAGRHQHPTENPVAQFARRHRLPLIKTDQFNTQFIDKFKKLKPDLGIVVAYGPPFFTPQMIAVPQYKIVNIHPSPLPAYRGAAPGPWQIIHGQKHSAVTFFQIDPNPDHGPIIAQIPFKISTSETAESLYQKAFKLAAKHLEPILKSYIANPKSLTPQNHSQKSYFPKLTKAQAQINWSWSPAKINRFIRALYPWPIAWTYVKNTQGRLLKMKMFPKNIVQIEGKKPIPWSQIKNYYRLVKT